LIYTIDREGRGGRSQHSISLASQNLLDELVDKASEKIRSDRERHSNL